jgi:phage tail-like protein
MQINQIQEISGLKMEQDVIELKHNSNDGKFVVKKISGNLKGGEVILTRGLTENNSFGTLIKDTRSGQMGDARKDGVIIVFDYEGNPSSVISSPTAGRNPLRSAP